MSKRELLTYIVIFLWVALGIFAVIYETDLIELASYFVSLTGFIGVYIFGETRRSSRSYHNNKSNRYAPGNHHNHNLNYKNKVKNTNRNRNNTNKKSINFDSKREFITYLVVIMWVIIGIWVIYTKGDLVGVSAYFAALTPFVGSYIIGETFRSDKIDKNKNLNE